MSALWLSNSAFQGMSQADAHTGFYRTGTRTSIAALFLIVGFGSSWEEWAWWEVGGGEEERHTTDAMQQLEVTE